jgi:ribosomal silencing factor RsfS
MTKHISDPDELITLIIAGIEDIKGQNISILDLRINRKFCLRLFCDLRRKL